MSDKVVELRSEINDYEGKKVEMKEGNEQLEEGNEASKMGNAQLIQQEESTESTIAIPTIQSDLSTSDLELEEEDYYVPNWLIEVLAFIYRKEMANSSLSTINKIFQLLCWPKLHQKVKPHKIPHLTCTSICDELGNLRAQFQRLDTREIIPIASTPAPHYIDGIGTIELDFVNEQVVDFIKSIDRLLQNCDLHIIYTFKSREMDNAASMHALLECLANKIFKFTILPSGLEYARLYLNDFNQLFPGILDQIQFLCFSQFLKIADFDTILNWLTNQANDGKQKIILFNFPGPKSHMAAFISRIKEEFSNSNLPSNFLICFAGFSYYNSFKQETFTLENAQTKEILTFYRRQGLYLYYLARYPKEEEHWKEDGEMKTGKAKSADSTIYI